MNLSEKLDGVIRILSAVVSPDGDKTQSREFELRFDLSGCTVEDIIDLALRPRRITWQNTHRDKKNFTAMELIQNILVKPIGARQTINPDVLFSNTLRAVNRLSPTKKVELKRLLDEAEEVEEVEEAEDAEKAEDR